MKRYSVATLGCRTNQYESQAWSDQLNQMGLIRAQEGEEADLCIVNTCTVTHSADSASRHQIRSLLRSHPQARILVTGCMAESAAQELMAIDARIEIVPNAKKEDLLEGIFPEELPEFQIQAFEGHTRAFVKVQDGCNSFCTYCIIPYVRGRSRSRTIGEVVREVEGLVAHGHQEVVLTGINVGDFDGQGEGNLAALVRAVDQVSGLKRLRISSIDPDEVNDELADAVLTGRTTCPSMHLVLQSGSNAILKRMNRKYTRQQFMEAVEKMQARNPDFTVTTDLIVGFPGESDADFADTLELVRQVDFAKIHVFPYSPRKRTRAALYPNQIGPELLQKRKSELLRAAEERAFQVRERFIGRSMSVLMEEGGEGHTENFLRVLLPGYPANTLVQVKLVANQPEGLVGVACDPH